MQTRWLDLRAFLRPGDRIVWGQACGEPKTLVEALIAQADSIGRLSAFAATSFSGILTAEVAERLQLSSMGAIGALRSVAAAGRLGIVPCHVGQVGPMIEQGLIGCAAALVQVSPPDDNGNHSFGLINDFVQAAVAKARVVIPEVNERVSQLVQAAAAKLRDLILAREPGTHVISTERAIHCRRTGRMIRERDT
jgi:acyl-CoA hydrolase